MNMQTVCGSYMALAARHTPEICDYKHQVPARECLPALFYEALTASDAGTSDIPPLSNNLQASNQWTCEHPINARTQPTYEYVQIKGNI